MSVSMEVTAPDLGTATFGTGEREYNMTGCHVVFLETHN